MNGLEEGTLRGAFFLRIEEIKREYGDATLQKPWCPPLILLRPPTAKECFCQSTYANADERMRE